MDGRRGGAALSVCVVVLAVVGLAPTFSWVPEVPLLVVGVGLPVAIFGLTGYRTARRSAQPLVAGVLAGSVAGILSGFVAGLAYVAFGKSPLNILVGALLGAIGGAIVAGAGSVLARRRPG